MTERAYIATRKGLFELAQKNGEWEIDARHFLGEPVSMVLPDARDGTLYAALNLGHFGAKLHRRDPGSADWTEISVPAYPEKPADSTDKTEWKLKQIWSLEAGGADQPGVLWAGTLPGGLFRSADRGDTWQLSTRYGTCRGVPTGLAAAMTRRASTASAWTRATAAAC